MTDNRIRVALIIPVHNAAQFLDDCLRSVASQACSCLLEVSIYNDACTDNSMDVVERWRDTLESKGFILIVGHPPADQTKPGGVGYAKNRAIEQSTAPYLCFLDADDEMDADRIQLQLDLAIAHPNAIVGCKFRRRPADSTARYTEWCNGLLQQQLMTQRFRECTVIMPTWFTTRVVWETVGRFDESGPGSPEDMIFFYRHIALGGSLVRVDKELVTYRYHTTSASFGVDRRTIFAVRVKAFEEQVLTHWSRFTIWNAGKEGRKLYTQLSDESRQKIVAFCDVDPNKIGRLYVHKSTKQKIPMIHFNEAKPPFVTCVKYGLTDGGFEENLQTVVNRLQLIEGVDFYCFS
eukprot:GILK01010472.1.p1 GENE.GILK01010472.1~~GILK01010472.1.p1  ORF type:complete len:360 (+),score=31.68 GILK01010472.1:36-1082(+)